MAGARARDSLRLLLPFISVWHAGVHEEGCSLQYVGVPVAVSKKHKPVVLVFRFGNASSHEATGSVQHKSSFAIGSATQYMS